MKFSIQLPTDRVDLPQEFVTLAAIQEMATQAETSGFNAVYVTDHPMPTVKWLESGGHHSLDPFVVLTAAAACTTTLLLHTHILVLAYRNPVLAAKSIASLDALSSGRLIVGAAVGYLAGEFSAMGVDFSRRGALTDESIQLMKRIWSESGICFSAEGGGAPDGGEELGNSALPRPFQQPHPPIWIGGNSRLAIQRAVKHGNGWAPFPAPAKVASRAGTAQIASIEDLGNSIEYMRTYADSIGRSEAMDVCMVPFGWGSLQNEKDRDNNAAEFLDQAAQLEALGVTWMAVSLPCSSRQEYVESLDWFGQNIIRHCK